VKKQLRCTKQDFRFLITSTKTTPEGYCLIDCLPREGDVVKLVLIKVTAMCSICGSTTDLKVCATCLSVSLCSKECWHQHCLASHSLPQLHEPTLPSGSQGLSVILYNMVEEEELRFDGIPPTKKLWEVAVKVKHSLGMSKRDQKYVVMRTGVLQTCTLSLTAFLVKETS
jgi:hypothetical protein